MGHAPAESVEGEPSERIAKPACTIDGSLIKELWQECDGANYGLELEEFRELLQRVSTAQNFGLAEGMMPARHQQAAYFRGLKLDEIVLAHACAAGKERAWERFVATYRQPLVRAAIAMTGSETLGRDLAEQLYAELFGLSEQGGQRRCPLASYRGRGTLMGWLRTTLAQRHVDHHRRNWRTEPLEEFDVPALKGAEGPPAAELTILEKAVGGALEGADAEDRLLLVAYFLDGRTLQQIGCVLHLHEATVSRKLKRVCEKLRKQILKNLQGLGLSRREAKEMMGVDPRDLDLNLRKLLQNSRSVTFQEKAAP